MRIVELWLIRHGQTLDNIQKILAGHTPGQLTQLGINQAKRTGQFLKNELFDFAYVSDLARTKATYLNIQSQMEHKIIPEKTIFTPLMREKGGGEYEGKPLELFRKNAADKKIPLRLFKGKGGECWDDVNKRAQQFLQTLANQHLKGDESNTTILQNEYDEEQKVSDKQEQSRIVKILGVSHGGFIMEVHNVIDLIQFNKKADLNNVAKNCSIHKIQISLKNGPNTQNNNQLLLKDLLITVVDKNNDNHCYDVK